MLIVNQICGEFKVHYKDLVSYHAAATQVMVLFKTFYIHYIPHNQNSYADALASLITSLASTQHYKRNIGPHPWPILP